MKLLICLVIAVILTAVFYGMLKYFRKKKKKLSTSIENYGFLYGVAIFGISLILSILIFHLLSSCPKIYHIEVVDDNGYLMDYWGTVCEYEIKDSVLSINDGMFEYKMKPGETIQVNHDNTFRF